MQEKCNNNNNIKNRDKRKREKLSNDNDYVVHQLEQNASTYIYIKYLCVVTTMLRNCEGGMYSCARARSMLICIYKMYGSIKCKSIFDFWWITSLFRQKLIMIILVAHCTPPLDAFTLMNRNFNIRFDFSIYSLILCHSVCIFSAFSCAINAKWY